MKQIKIFSLGEMENEGKQIAFVFGNRDIAKANLKNKMESLSKYRRNLVPIMVVEGTKVVADGYKLVNPSDGETIPNEDASKYLAIVDGQHRYKAYLELKEEAKRKGSSDDSVDNESASTLPELYFYVDYSDIPTNKLLSVANMDSFKYSSKDFAKGAAAFSSDSELAKFVNEYTEKGVSVSTLSIYIYGRSGILKNKNLGELMQGKQPTIQNTSYIDMAKAILPPLINKFGIKFAKTRYCADAIWNVLTKIGTDNYQTVIDAINKLSDENKNDILKQKGDEGQDKLTTMLEVLCKKLYQTNRLY